MPVPRALVTMRAPRARARLTRVKMDMHPAAAPTRLYLKPHEDRRVRLGHPWVYSNEIDAARAPLAGITPGAAVAVHDHRGQLVGSGYVNPHTLIAVRLLSRGMRVLDGALLRERLATALALRERLYPRPYYRLVYGDSDGLSGLIVDRYGDYLVAQLLTAGMQRVAALVVAALDEVLAPHGILLRNDSPARTLEGLPTTVESARGKVPATITVEDHALCFSIDPWAGQKTGWFYDQRDNRACVAAYTSGARVLDLMSYVGGFGITAARAGAREVLCVDSSATALALLQDNANTNGVAERVRTQHGDAFEVLQALRNAGEHFDVVIADPPAFIKRRKDEKSGIEAYERLNQLALGVLHPGGILASCSCSYHLERDALRTVLARAAHRAGRALQILESGGQAADLPALPVVPETAYLKMFIARALPLW